MSVVGPVCHIPPVTTTFAKDPVPIPAVPPPAQATLQSLQHTVNQLRQIIVIITGQQGGNGQVIQSPKPPGGSFQQTSQTVQKVRVFQNNDSTSSNWVDVDYVTHLVMGNNSTKSTWTYNAPPPEGA